MKKLAFGVSAFALLVAAPSFAYEHNVDIKNLGPDAYDVAVVLQGKEGISGTFPGYTAGHPLAGNFSYIPVSLTSGGDTVIHWQNMWDGTDNIIQNGQTVHIGWTASDCHSTIKDMYWTTKSGGRVPGSVVLDVLSGVKYQSTRPVITFEHAFLTDQAIAISNVRFTVVQEGLPLDQLTSVNRELMDQLQPLMPDTFEVAPGQIVSFDAPVEVQEGQSLIVVYDISGSPDQPGRTRMMSNANLTNFVQVRNPPVGTDPCGGIIANPNAGARGRRAPVKR